MTPVLSGPTPAQILDNISMLYELSLGIGTSLNLQENCHFFVNKFMSRQSLSFFAIYLNQSLRTCTPQRDCRPEVDDHYRCLYACPELSGRAAELTGAWELVQETHQRGFVCAPCRDFATAVVNHLTHAGQANRSAPEGILTTMSVGQGAAIVIFVSQMRTQPYAPWELNQLRLLLDKFGRSVEACLDHEDLRKETAARLDLEQRLSRAKRMESLGLMAGGVAHDLGNILNPLCVYPEMIQAQLPPESKEQKMLTQIQRAVQQATAMMQDLLSLARTGGGRTEILALEQPVRAYLQSPSFLALQAEHPEIHCRAQVDTQAQIRGGAASITRVVLNLVTNAFEELRGEGNIFIRVLECDRTQAHVGYELIPAGEYVVLSVQDDGSGIDEQALGSIFEPFFSKKKLGRSGSGLGLAVVYGIVKDLDGFIDIITSPAGTEFLLYFPRHAAPARSTKVPVPRPLVMATNVMKTEHGQTSLKVKAALCDPRPPRQCLDAKTIITTGVARMPSDLRAQLQAALQSLDDEWIAQVLAQLPPEQEGMKAAIAALVEEFQYDQLIPLLKPLAPG